MVSREAGQRRIAGLGLGCEAARAVTGRGGERVGDPAVPAVRDVLRRAAARVRPRLQLGGVRAPARRGHHRRARLLQVAQMRELLVRSCLSTLPGASSSHACATHLCMTVTPSRAGGCMRQATNSFQARAACLRSAALSLGGQLCIWRRRVACGAEHLRETCRAAHTHNEHIGRVWLHSANDGCDVLTAWGRVLAGTARTRR